MSLANVLYGTLLKTPLGTQLSHVYPYNHRPHQMCALVAAVNEAIERFPSGTLAEVGCFRGHTSVFLATHVAAVAPGRAYKYNAYDTFSGFVTEDVSYEIEDRKLDTKRSDFSGFSRNDIRWVQENVDRNASATIPISLHAANASTHDFAELEAPIFMLIDVDLYKPTLNVLERLWERMQPGALIVLDDCTLGPDGTPALSDLFSGGHAALLFFAESRGIPIEYVADKLAIIRR